jgi:hypothetical protein
MARRYGEAELKLMAKAAEASLTTQDGPLAKIESWRHQIVAHRTPNGRADIFYIRNKMNPGDVAEGLRQLEKLLNTLLLEMFHVHNDTKTGSEDIVQQGAELFGCIAGQ